MKRKRKGGCVYILTNECFRPYDGRLVKVGKTSGSVGRIGTLNTSCPEDFRVYKLVRTEDNSYQEIETEVFRRMWNVRHFTKQCEPTEFLHCTPRRALDVIRRIVKERHYHVTYTTLNMGRSGSTIKSNTERTGRRFRNGRCFIGGTASGAALMEKLDEKRYVVKKRSHIANVGNLKKLHSKRVVQMRKDYKRQISSRGILNCDVPCKSVSEAAKFVCGFQVNGNAFWHKM